MCSAVTYLFFKRFYHHYNDSITNTTDAAISTAEEDFPMALEEKMWESVGKIVLLGT